MGFICVTARSSRNGVNMTTPSPLNELGVILFAQETRQIADESRKKSQHTITVIDTTFGRAKEFAGN